MGGTQKYWAYRQHDTPYHCWGGMRDDFGRLGIVVINYYVIKTLDQKQYVAVVCTRIKVAHRIQHGQISTNVSMRFIATGFVLVSLKCAEFTQTPGLMSENI